jgi:hypothetical protein
LQSFVDWMKDEKHGFYVREVWNEEKKAWIGPGKMILQEFQERIFSYCLTPGPDGKFPFETLLLSMIKKSGKTAIAAAIESWYAEQLPPESYLFCIANDEEQAEGLVMGDIRYHAREAGYKTLKGKVELPNGTTIQSLSQSYKSVAGGRHAMTVWDELWGYCQGVDSQCYTWFGWKSYDELRVGDMAATITMDGVWEWQPVQAVNAWSHKGKMIRLRHRRANQLVTENHKVLGQFRSSGGKQFGGLELKEARDAMKTYEMLLPVGAKWVGTSTGFSDAWLYLTGMWIAEGFYKVKTGKEKQIIYLAQDDGIKSQKGDTKERIEQALKSIRAEYRRDEHKFTIYGGFANWVVDNIRTGAYNKEIPAFLKEATPHELAQLFAGYMDGDGWVAGKGWQCGSVSPRLRDGLVEIGIKLGYTAKYMKSNRGNQRLSFSLGNIRLDKRNWEVVDFDGAVWCPTLKNGTWLSRRDGCIAWTGNTSEASRRAWDEMTPIPTVANSLRIIATYAGFENESDLLWDLYLQGVGKEENEKGQGELIPGLEDLPCWKNGNLFTFWDHEPRMPWQTDEYYLSQRKSLRPSAFIRLHTNSWTSSDEEFIPIEWWDRACKVFEKPADQDPNHPFRYYPVTISVDASTKRDCTAISGWTHDSVRGKTIMLFHQIWTPKAGEDFDLEATVENYIIEKTKTFHIVSVRYDPRDLHQTMTRLRARGIPCEEYIQNVGNMVKASQAFYVALQYNNIEAYPNEEWRKHIQMAVAENKGQGFRIVKDKGNRKAHVDGAISSAMGVWDAINRSDLVSTDEIRVNSPYSDTTTWKQPTAESKLPFEFQS